MPEQGPGGEGIREDVPLTVLAFLYSEMFIRAGHEPQAKPREDGQRSERIPETYEYPVWPRRELASVVHVSRRSAMNNLKRVAPSTNRTLHNQTSTG